MPRAHEITKTDYEKLAEFRYALRRFLRFSEQAAAKLGLTPQHHQALLAIEGFPGRNRITVTELAERLQLEHHSTVELANRLALRKLLVREHSTTDRRQVYLRLTPKGKSALQKISLVHSAKLKSTGKELIQLLQALHTLPGFS